MITGVKRLRHCVILSENFLHSSLISDAKTKSAIDEVKGIVGGMCDCSKLLKTDLHSRLDLGYANHS